MLRFDRSRLLSKLASLEEYHYKIYNVYSKYVCEEDTFIKDLYMDSIKLNFRNFSEAMIDVMQHLHAKNCTFSKALNAIELVDSMLSLKLVSKEYSLELQRLIRLRNRIIHQYYVPQGKELTEFLENKNFIFKDFVGIVSKLIKDSDPLAGQTSMW